ncbi:histidinol-phosphatase [Rudaeicoccus suwonensis]|uniref:Histidinol-phosphatase n=1 Tax=Rudaeicoccus suwonensis TaxID=657409 RepID=A0A561E1G1_9MICO|nr:histidinol-phosphatase [Rudaeicoccus suwonensis]TWE09444.1 histidinol-phosphate phosphatase [Rudaeicoccus suwonensis]
MPSYDDDLRLAHVLADTVEPLTMGRFRATDLHVDTKPDLTPVTDADTSTEEAIRAQLKRARPRDAVLGEEQGTEGNSERLWVIDPIDGTKNFVRGVPVWATLIALVVADTPVLGLVAAPALGRRWWAGRGTGAWSGRNLSGAKAIHVSGVSQLADASLSLGDWRDWAEIDRREQMLGLLDSVWRVRGYGDFWSHMLVAEGACDVAPEPSLEVYDMAALAPIVTEAGGRFTGLDGRDGPWSGNALSSNGLLHDEVLARLAAPARP